MLNALMGSRRAALVLLRQPDTRHDSQQHQRDRIDQVLHSRAGEQAQHRHGEQREERVGLHPAVPRGGACDHPGDAVDREHLQADGVHDEGVATLPGHGSYTQPEGEDAQAHAHPRSVDDAVG